MRKATIYTGSIALVLILGVLTSSVFAQGLGRGRLKGKLSDENDKPVNGITITMTFAGTFNPQTGEFKPSLTKSKTVITAKTKNKGEFIFMNLATGAYDVTVDVQGYRTINRRVSVYQGMRNPLLILKLRKSDEVLVKEKLTSDATFVEQGNALFAEGKFEEAMEAFKQFQEKTPEFFEIHINIGNCLVKMEKYDEAIAEFNKFLEKAKEGKPEVKAKALASIGEIYIKKEDMETAQDYFKKSVDLNPKDEILAYNVGEIYFGNNKNEEAVKYLSIASQIKPQWGTPHLKLGYVYLNLGDMKKAVEHFSKFVKLDPENPEVPAINDLIKSLKDM
jgi:Tfp pilus assembly protein PilF